MQCHQQLSLLTSLSVQNFWKAFIGPKHNEFEFDGGLREQVYVCPVILS